MAPSSPFGRCYIIRWENTVSSLRFAGMLPCDTQARIWKMCHLWRSDMDSTVSIYNERLHNDYLSSKKWEQHTSQNQFELYVTFHESRMIVRSGMKTTIEDLKSLPPFLTCQIEFTETIVRKTNMFHSDLLKIDQNCFQILSRLLHEQFQQLCKSTATKRHVKMIFPASAFISGNNTPTMQSTDDGYASKFESFNLRLIQDLVARERFYGSRKVSSTLFFVKEALETPWESWNIR